MAKLCELFMRIEVGMGMAQGVSEDKLRQYCLFRLIEQSAEPHQGPDLAGIRTLVNSP